MTLAPTYARYDVTFESGAGCVLTDVDGVEYLDFLSGIAVNNLGHCHPAVVSVVQEQVARLMHISNLFYNAPNVDLADRLTTRSFDILQAPQAGGYFLGDYIGLVASGDTVHPAFGIVDGVERTSVFTRPIRVGG